MSVAGIVEMGMLALRDAQAPWLDRDVDMLQKHSIRMVLLPDYVELSWIILKYQR